MIFWGTDDDFEWYDSDDTEWEYLSLIAFGRTDIQLEGLKSALSAEGLKADIQISQI